MEDEDLIPLSEAAVLCGLSQPHLNLLARQGKLRAKKIGRNWVTTHTAVLEYLGDAAKRSKDPLKHKR